MNDKLKRARKGITPIIAIVLLLMMTVAAAGGAYAWLTQLQDQFQNRANENLNRDITVIDMQCYNEDGVGFVEVFFKNSGQANLDLDPIDMNVMDAASGNINYSLTRSSISLAYSDGGPAQSRIYHPGGDSHDFETPGDSSAYKIAVGSSNKTLSVGGRYEIDFIFTDEDSTTKVGSCQARER